jgi:transcriptional regulator with XRE-family HTH domain
MRNLAATLPDMEATEVMVRGWLAASGLNASAAARRAGVSASTLHRVLNGVVDPSVGTLREIALACGMEMALTAHPLSDPQASAAARAMLEIGYEPSADREIAAWRERLARMAESGSPVDIVKAAAAASSPLHRRGAILLSGELPLARIASAGDAAKGRWAISGAAGLYLPPPSAAAPAVTILWCEDVRTVIHLLAETELRQTHRPDRAALAVISGEPELFIGSFTEGIVRYAAPIQIILDCLSQPGTVADDAMREAVSW